MNTTSRKNTWPLAANQTLPVLAILLLAFVAYAFEDDLLASLIYHRTFILQGEYWRLFTGHIFHTNGNHLLLNLAGLTLLWSLHGQYYQCTRYLLLTLFSALSVSLGLLCFSPELSQYVGLSGILHGIFIWGALTDIQHKLKSGYLLLLGIVLKVSHEQIYGASNDITTLINAKVAIDAHLWGMLAGVCFFFINLLFVQYSRHKKTDNQYRL